MSEKIYIRPLGFVPGPQSEHGNAIRLAGGMAYASRFAIILRRAKEQGGAVVERWLAAPDTMAEVLGGLPDPVVNDAEAQWAGLQKAHVPLELGGRTLRFDQPQVVGILNVTPDSFSDGGHFLDDAEAGRAHAAAMQEAGAALIDIGGESTRPGAAKVWEGDEIERVRPAIETCAGMGAAISIDTRNAATMEAALDAGAHIVNDVSALRHDPRSLELVAERQCPVILMHSPSAGDDPHEGGDYGNVIFDVFDFLRERRDAAIAAGVAADRIILDPGIGFGKSLADNLALINALPMFHTLGCPVLLGVSRKRMIGALSREEGAENRLSGSIALATSAMNAGVQLIRAHDVPETVQARNVWRGLRDAALTEFADLPQE